MNDTAGLGALGLNADELLGEAIAAERAGERTKALDLLGILVESRPQHEEAWMWIAKLVESPTEKIEALEIVLNINPHNPSARQYMDTLCQRQQRATQDFKAVAEDHYRRGQQALKDHNEKEALRCFSQTVHLNPDHLAAWQQLAERSVRLAEKSDALKNIVRLRPGDQRVRQKYRQLAQIQKNLLAVGRYYDQNKLHQLAAEAYQQAIYASRSAATRLEAQRLLEDAQIRCQIPGYRSVNPAFTLARLSLGPMVLYALLVIIQAGMNPLHVSPILCPSGILVAGGSILLAALHEKSTQVIWLRLYGHRHGEKYLAAWFSILGFVMLLMPYLFVLFDSLLRLRMLEL